MCWEFNSYSREPKWHVEYSDEAWTGQLFSRFSYSILYFLALPVNDATNDRSFSKLKLIKSYLQSTMAQDRWSDLGILSIEKERLSEIYGNAIKESFAQTKARKKTNFNYCLNTNCVCQLQLCQFVNSVSHSDSICVSCEYVWTMNVVSWVMSPYSLCLLFYEVKLRCLTY